MDILSTVGGYLEYRGGVPYRGYIMSTKEGYHKYRGDILSTVGDTLYRGGIS